MYMVILKITSQISAGDPAATGLRVPDVTLTIRSDDEYLVDTMLFSSQFH